MATCAVTGTIFDPTGTGISGATVQFLTQNPQVDIGNAFVMPVAVSTTTTSGGVFSLSLDQGISGIFQISVNVNGLSPQVLYSFGITVPATASTTLAALYTATGS